MKRRDPMERVNDRSGIRVAAMIIVMALVFVLTAVLTWRPWNAGDGTGAPPGPTTGQPPIPTAPPTPPRATSNAPAHDRQHGGPVEETGYLAGVRDEGGHLLVTLDRVVFLTGDAATAANGGVPPDNDHVIINSNRRLRTYPVADDATLTGVTVLGTDESATSAEALTAEQFLDLARGALADGTRPLVDLRHRSARDVTVVDVHERYVP